MKLFNKNSFEKASILYDKYNKTLYNKALRILNDSFEAEEVMHDTLLKYLKISPVFNSEQEKTAWLNRVCINLSIDRYRKKGRERSFLNSISDEYELSNKFNYQEEIEIQENDLFNRITIQKIKDTLNELSDGYRIIITLCLFEGYDYQEIAQILKIKEVTVRSQYIRGKTKLIQLLNKSN